MEARIRCVSPHDAAQIHSTVISFEHAEPSVEEMRRRITEVSTGYPWFVCCLPNPASVALHENMGFRKSGVFERASSGRR